MVNEIDLKHILGMIRRQIWFIITVSAIVVFIVGLLAYSLTPKYTATAILLVDTSSKNLLDPQARQDRGSFDDARVESEAEIVASDGVLLDVIQKENLIADPEFGITAGLRDKLYAMFRLPLPAPASGEQALGQVLQSFRKAITVRRNALTYLISVEVVSEQPQKAARLVNSITDSYISKQVESKVSTTIAARNIIQKRVADASRSIVDSEKKLDVFISDNLTRIEKETGSLGISVLRQQLERLDQNRLKEAAKVELAQRSLQNGDLGTLVATLQSDAVKKLQQDRDALAANIAATGSESSQSIDLRSELKKLDEALQTKTNEEIGGLKDKISAYQSQADNLKQQIRSSILNSNLPPEVLTDIFSLQQSAQIARAQFQSLLQRLQDLNAQADLQIADSRVVSAAMVPPKPSFPNKTLFVGLALVAGLGLGFGLAILREYFVGGFTDDEQVEQVLNIPLASVMPSQSIDTANNPDSLSIADMMVQSPLSVFSESVRRIRVKIGQVLYNRSHHNETERHGGTVIMVASSEPMEGKTTIAVALARAFAQSGKATLLIDCDLRKPSVHKHLGIEDGPGMNDFLRNTDGMQPLSNMTTRDKLSNLSVIVGGKRGTFATDDLFMGDRIVRLLTLAKKHFDYIIIDTPPIAPVVDGLYLARHADVIAFVIKWANTAQSLSRKSVAALAESAKPGTPIVAVLNQKEQAKINGYAKYAEYYSE